MKRIFTLLLCAAMLITFAACGKEAEPTAPAVTVTPTDTPTDAPTQAPTQAPTDAPTFPPELTIIQLVDNEDVAVHITGIDHNEHMGMQLQMQCENRTDRALLFSWDMVSVCGYMYDPVWSEEVGAGKTVNSIVYLDTYELEKMGIASVDEITFTLNIVDSENWMEAALVQNVFTVYPTGLNADTVQLPQREAADSQAVIADNEDLRFVIEWVDTEDADECTVYVYLENKSVKDLMYLWDTVTVNGQTVDSFWSTFVAAGKRACSQITFYRADLEAKGITDISEIGFTLLVSDYDDWEADYLLEQTYTYKP